MIANWPFTPIGDHAVETEGEMFVSRFIAEVVVALGLVGRHGWLGERYPSVDEASSIAGIMSTSTGL